MRLPRVHDHSGPAMLGGNEGLETTTGVPCSTWVEPRKQLWYRA